MPVLHMNACAYMSCKRAIISTFATPAIQGCCCLHAGGARPSDACSICPAGTYAPGGNTQPCKQCAFGYTSAAGSTSEEQCYSVNACPAGTELRMLASAPSSVNDCVCKPGYGSSTGRGPCQLCPPNTYSTGGTLEDCKPCGWGMVSAAGATDKAMCQNSPQACPIGQWAPKDAISKEQCGCYPGFGGECATLLNSLPSRSLFLCQGCAALQF